MSATTQVLFNSPALNSLKRDQLVKLCKRHGLKANGKNTELIERLKVKATELPPEAIEWRDDSDSDEELDPLPANLFQQQPPRPSEQWEIVMDNIEEEDELSSAANTLTSIRSVRNLGTAGEFGTTTTKSSVTSSLKAAITNSFGLKRAALGKNADAADKATTRSLPNLPSSSSLTSEIPRIEEPPVEPIPGAPSRPGMPAPAHARLSTGTRAGATTTIRLISSSSKSVLDTPPRLAPYQTTLDLDLGTPSATRKNVWPASPGNALTSGRLYPTIPAEDLRPALPSPWKSTVSMTGTPGKATPTKSSLNKELPSVGPDDIFSPAKPTPGGSSVKKEAAPSPQLRPTSRLSVPQNEPFLFGSPLPRHSMTNTQFDNAAADVLAEMNRRLAAAGVPKVEKTVLETAGKSSAPSALPAKAAPSATAERFNKAHDQAFNKMDSIANHYAARRPAPGAASSAVGAAAGPASKKRKSDALGPGAGPAAKRKSNVAQARVFSNGNRKKMGIPGGFGMDDDDDDENENDAPEEDADAADRRASKRIRVAEGEDVHKGRRVSLLPQDGKTDAERAAEERRREKEREVLKRKIDARRRSSRGRPSVGGRAAPAAATKAKPARFGFFGAAKTLVRSVWNMGAGGNSAAKPAGTTAKAAVPPPQSKPTTAQKAPVPRKPSGSGIAKPPIASSSQLRVPSATASSIPSARSRSPIPSFDSPEPTGTLKARTAPLNMRKTSNPTKLPFGVAATSLGARPSAAAAGSSNTTSSLGMRRPTNAAPASGSLAGTKSPSPSEGGSIPVRKRTISTLMAPTASSLAKRQSVVAGRAPGLAAVGEQPTSPALTLQQITNARSPRSPPTTGTRPTRIFSQPLSSPSVASTTGANENMSLTAGASALLAQAVPPKPKALVARKPRISRSKVIAKLGQQRSVSGSSRASAGSAGRARSSIGAAPRRSIGAVKGQRVVSGAGGGDVLMSAKRRARQSEYARRKSRIMSGSSIGAGAQLRVQGGDADMDVDG